MPDEEASETVERESVQDGLPTQSIDSPLPPQGPTSPTAKPIGNSPNPSEISQLKDEIRAAEKWMIWLTGAIAFFGLCTIGVGLLQWNVMKGQLKEMHDGGTDTHNLAEAAKTQAAQAKIQAQAAKISADAAKSASETAAATLKQTQGAFVIQQRPYVWVDRFDIKSVSKGEPITVDVHFVNYGSTPARDVANYIQVAFGKTVDQLCDVFSFPLNERGSGILGAGRSDLYKTVRSVETPGAPASKIIPWDGSRPVVVYGRIFYRDRVGNTYRSKFCVEVLEGGASLFVEGKNVMDY